MTSDTALRRAKDIASSTVATAAAENDRLGRFSSEAIDALGGAGLLGLMLPADVGGAGLGPRAFADVVTALSEADASVAMVFVMHTLAALTIAAAPRTPALERVLGEIAAGHHVSTLAFSEAGSRSHFWAPVSRAISLDGSGARISARKSFVTGAGHVHSYVTSALAPNGAGPTDSTLYLVDAKSSGLTVSAPWDGLGLRANASSPVILDGCVVSADLRLTEDGMGFATMLNTVLPLFNVGQAAVSLGICRSAVSATVRHLKSARFEHLGATLGESLPNLRAQLATMQIESDGLAARLDDTLNHLESPGELTMLRVLEVKAAASETAIGVTALAMKTCGGAALSRQHGIERLFRDAQAGSVMAPTTDVLRDFIGKALLGLPLF
ncbi:MAG TPA: acyl-CoA dehydrogenase family protein [Vicinamibacterales bacterium]|nr:acyl-CoA dehydrogenase family protein [Vicinamibacterales bacterium]